MKLTDILRNALLGVAASAAITGCGGMTRELDDLDAGTDADPVVDADNYDGDVLTDGANNTCPEWEGGSGTAWYTFTAGEESRGTLRVNDEDHDELSFSVEDRPDFMIVRPGDEPNTIAVTLNPTEADIGEYRTTFVASDGLCSGTKTIQYRVVSEPVPQCSDGIDNDGDGLIDFDTGTVSTTLTVEEGAVQPVLFRGETYSVGVERIYTDPSDVFVTFNGFSQRLSPGGVYEHPDGTTLVINEIIDRDDPETDSVRFELSGDGSDRGCSSADDDSEQGEVDICELIPTPELYMEDAITSEDPFMGNTQCGVRGGMPPYTLTIRLDTGDSTTWDRPSTGWIGWEFHLEGVSESTCIVEDACGTVLTATGYFTPDARHDTQCNDGIDNDLDGLVDGDDNGCTGPDDDYERVDLNDLYEIFIDGTDFNGTIVVGTDASRTDIIASTDIAMHIQYLGEEGSPIPVGSAVLSDAIDDPAAQDMIVLGNECHNPLIADMLGVPYPTCGDDMYTQPGEYRIKIIEYDTPEHGRHFSYLVMGNDDAMTEMASGYMTDPEWYNERNDFVFPWADEAVLHAMCSDHSDNDRDGLYDMDDPDCSSPSDNHEGE